MSPFVVSSVASARASASPPTASTGGTGVSSTTSSTTSYSYSSATSSLTSSPTRISPSALSNVTTTGGYGIITDRSCSTLLAASFSSSSSFFASSSTAGPTGGFNSTQSATSPVVDDRYKLGMLVIGRFPDI